VSGGATASRSRRQVRRVAAPRPRSRPGRASRRVQAQASERRGLVGATAEERREELVTLFNEVKTCTKCPLHEARTKAVFGAGDANADLMFVGEAPGAEEDRQGLPFVGRAGQLL